MNINSLIRHKFFFPAQLFIICFILYGNTLQNGYAFDDYIYTYHNDFIKKGFSAIKDIFDKGSLYGVTKDKASQYRPLTLLSFMVEVSIFSFNPHISHFFSIFLFALTTVLLYFFLQKILIPKQIASEEEGQMLWHKQAIIISATLLFAFHPIHSEVVDSIKSRDEILGLLFGLLSFYFLMLHVEKSAPLNHYSYRDYTLSLIAFIIALFCKESCLTYLAIIPLLLYFFTSLELKQIGIKTIPYIMAVVFYLYVRCQVLQSITFTNQIPVWENALMSTNNVADRIAASFVLLGKYMYMTIIPYPLSFDYSYNQIPIVSWGNIKPILSVLVCLIMLGFML
jgi:hypothetical protein